MKVKVNRISKEKAVEILISKIPLPEPIIEYQSLFGFKRFENHVEFEKKYIQMKDGRWRKRRFWEQNE